MGRLLLEMVKVMLVSLVIIIFMGKARSLSSMEPLTQALGKKATEKARASSSIRRVKPTLVSGRMI